MSKTSKWLRGNIDFGSKFSNVDLTHPYYIHHFNRAGYSLVTIELNGTNYQSGKSFMHEQEWSAKIFTYFNQIKWDKITDPGVNHLCK